MIVILVIDEFEHFHFHEEKLQDKKECRYTKNSKHRLIAQANIDEEYNLDTIASGDDKQCEDRVS